MMPMKKTRCMLALCALLCLLMGLAFAAEAPSDDWMDYQVMLDGALYTLPTPLQTLYGNGWTLKDQPDETLKPNRYTLSQRLVKGDMEVYVQVINLSIDELPMGECLVGQISLDAFQAKKGAALIVAKGITLGSAKDDVDAAFGLPGNTYESATRVAYTYSSDSYCEMKIDIDAETKLVAGLAVKCFNEPEGYNDAAMAAPDEVPEAITAYAPPAELGDDLLSFNIRVGDALYTLPVSLPYMESQGWVLTGVNKLPAKIPAWGSQSFVTVVLGGFKMDTQLANWSPKATAPGNCFVSTFRIDAGTGLDVELPRGITLGMAKEDLDKALEGVEGVEADEGSSYYSYRVRKEVLQEVSLIVGKETNTVMTIEVKCR